MGTFKKEVMTLGKDYLLKGLNRDLQKEFKTACAHFEISMKATLVKHMQNIINEYRKDRLIDHRPKIYKDVKGKK